MQLTTDSVLLGAWVWAEAAGGVTAGTTGAVAGTVVPQTVLDVGTGCGVLALMMAQRFEQACIHALDIDGQSVSEARENADLSPWPERIRIVEGDFRQCLFSGPYDLVVTNPPYFRLALEPEQERRARARHTGGGSLTHEELLQGVVRVLAADGTFALILPAGQEAGFLSVAITGQNPLYPSRITRVVTGKSSPAAGNVPPTRVLLELTKKQTTPRIETLFMVDAIKDKYNPQYINLVKDFYLWA